ncbi:MAG: hypothetical protein WCG25_08420 [bacterium]
MLLEVICIVNWSPLLQVPEVHILIQFLNKVHRQFKFTYSHVHISIQVSVTVFEVYAVFIDAQVIAANEN